MWKALNPKTPRLRVKKFKSNSKIQNNVIDNQKEKDNRVVKCILHRVADIPGGVTVQVANLGGSALFEGTPIGKGSNGLYVVCKTAQVINRSEPNRQQLMKSQKDTISSR